jgi:hypothetical protein
MVRFPKVKNDSFLSREMKPVRIVAGIMIGAALATALAWLSLYVFGVFVLHGQGSLFDASRTAENAFFIFWFALIAAFSIAGGYAGYANATSRN